MESVRWESVRLKHNVIRTTGEITEISRWCTKNPQRLPEPFHMSHTFQLAVY